jgi:hypothetical protein
MMKNVDIIEIPAYSDPTYGKLVPVETEDSIPFCVKRIYYIYDVPEAQRRGFHSHIELKQALICVHGSVMIHVRMPGEAAEYRLDDPQKVLLIGPMIWREMYDFSSDAVLLVLANEHYDVSDYLRDYEAYEKLAIEYFK